MRVFILGAGFSKSAGMPLATELTDALIEKTIHQHHLDEMNDWVAGLQNRLRWLERDNSPAINIEQLFHYARFDQEIWKMQQHLSPVGRQDGETPWGKAESIDAWLSYFEDDLVEVLWEKQSNANLDPITRFAERLKPGDAVLTFNYDTLLEMGLSKLNKPWHHCLNDTNSSGIAVLKLHGSVDWILLPRGSGNHKTYTLLFSKEDQNQPPSKGEHEYHRELHRVKNKSDLDHAIENRDLNNLYFGLAGLGSHKPLHRLPGSGMVWAKADGALREATEIFIIGFSLSPFDTMAQFYFGSTMQQRHKGGGEPTRIILVDPNGKNLVNRFKSVFGDNIEVKDTKAESIDWSELLTD